MLIEIKCDKFREKVIKFKSGLNVVLGDDKATNSIGKTTLLMVIDMVYGGNSFYDRSKDVIDVLGEHEYFFKFKFNDKHYCFSRSTSDHSIVVRCDFEYNPIRSMSIDEYRQLLKSLYKIENYDLKFRSLVSLFSRIWRKGNTDVTSPLHTHQNESFLICIEKLIKIYDKYKSIEEYVFELKDYSQKIDAYKKAKNKNLIPTLNKNKYKENKEVISTIKSEINDIKENLAKYAVSIREITNREMLELKNRKDVLVSTKSELEVKLQRVDNNLKGNRYIKSRHLQSLIEYFPDVNYEKLDDIESFHSGISLLLKNELQDNKRELNKNLSVINEEINEIDKKINATLSNIDSPEAIVDRVFELSNTYNKSSKYNEYYNEENKIKEGYRDTKTKMTEHKSKILDNIQELINSNLVELTARIYGTGRKPPFLSLNEHRYSYEVLEDTGTGTAYSSMIMLDLSVFYTTSLPILIHDSLLFKNIQNEAITNIIDIYLEYEKQIFISIDEKNKYGNRTALLLLKHSVLSLDGNNVLYIQNWKASENMN